MKIYLDTDQLGKTKLTVDGKTVPYGKDNAEEFTKEEVQRLVDAAGDSELIKVVGQGSVPDPSDDDNDETEEGDSE